jgi:prevent-host-death family protein
MERTISATEARVKFGEVMQRIADSGESVIVERDGVPSVAIISIEDYKRFKGEASPWAQWLTNLRHLHERIRAELGDAQLPSSVEIIREMREERDEQLASLR